MKRAYLRGVIKYVWWVLAEEKKREEKKLSTEDGGVLG
jgi:hypothetical protein